jgi:hypothetical protein
VGCRTVGTAWAGRDRADVFQRRGSTPRCWRARTSSLCAPRCTTASLGTGRGTAHASQRTARPQHSGCVLPLHVPAWLLTPNSPDVLGSLRYVHASLPAFHHRPRAHTPSRWHHCGTGLWQRSRSRGFARGQRPRWNRDSCTGGSFSAVVRSASGIGGRAAITRAGLCTASILHAWRFPPTCESASANLGVRYRAPSPS